MSKPDDRTRMRAPLKKPVHVVSLSGGKDSQATALLCLQKNPTESVRLVFCDTGNEHELTYEHLDYLEEKLAIKIDRLKADFTDQIARKRAYIISTWPEKGVPAAICARAAAILVPTGNPFLDLCLWKGRFPSRMAQFCTQELKRRLLDGYCLDLLHDHDVHSWQGVRRDESANRAHLPDGEQAAEGWRIERPIAAWTAQEVVDFCLKNNTRLNPLYSQGMKRVGCMPCINCAKSELAEIAGRFPEVIDRIREWESLVSIASKRQDSSFFAAPEDQADRTGRNIDERVAWSKTSRGGLQLDLLKTLPPSSCSSVYGLCE